MNKRWKNFKIHFAWLGQVFFLEYVIIIIRSPWYSVWDLSCVLTSIKSSDHDQNNWWNIEWKTRRERLGWVGQLSFSFISPRETWFHAKIMKELGWTLQSRNFNTEPWKKWMRNYTLKSIFSDLWPLIHFGKMLSKLFKNKFMFMQSLFD